MTNPPLARPLGKNKTRGDGVVGKPDDSLAQSIILGLIGYYVFVVG